LKHQLNIFSYPYVIWMLLFILIPLLLVIGYAGTVKNPADGSLSFSLDNFSRFITSGYLTVLWRSLLLAFIATVITLIMGYPMAMITAFSPVKLRNSMLLFLILPMWMNFLLRTYAWMSLLGNKGLINQTIIALGGEPIQFLYNNGAVVFGMVCNFLPFMILPIYTVLSRLNQNILEAAQDLGANQYKVFFRVILPLSVPGIISGITMVFMPAVSTFVISRLLGGGKNLLIGNLVEQQFLSQGNWNFGSAISLIMMVVILISMAVMNYFDGDKEDRILW